VSAGGSQILTTEESARLFMEWNGTAVPYPASECVHGQFARQAAQTPHAIALVFENESLTYRDLDERSTRLARHLIGMGAGPEILVGVAMDRSLDLVITLLAILKVGSAYLPLDPAYPQRRLELVMDDAQPVVIVTQQRFASLFPPHQRVLAVDGESAGIARESTSPLDQPSSSTNPAYVIYTSGSTGKPKGVLVEHRNVVSFFTAMDHVLGDRPAGVWLALTSIAFDISVLELLWTLTRGFQVILQGDEKAGSGSLYSVVANIRRHGVTHLQCTPSLVRILIADRDTAAALSGLQKLLLGGEALPVSLANQVAQLFPGAIYNMYGPTETTIWSTTYRLDLPATSIPIGRPIPNTQTYVLDEQLAPVPIGKPGELYIAGAGVVRGYLRRPDLTAERFIPNPFSDDPGARMYKTGDIARYLPDGNLEYLGRADFQVKVRGFRIELGEIEAVLERHPGVRQAVVNALEERAGGQRLIAYLVFAPESSPAAGELRSFLRENLPEHMQPSALVAMREMPLTANGKIDRRALPPLEKADLLLECAYEAANTELERRIVDLWKDALDIDHVGIDSNFYDLGAHSLLVAEVHIKLQEVLGRELPVVAMFRYPTVRTLAAYLQEEEEDGSVLSRSAVRGKVRQQSLQQRRTRRTTSASSSTATEKES
jgi:amino acid adenylation domain-containing protein